jgi:hypothetical protein
MSLHTQKSRTDAAFLKIDVQLIDGRAFARRARPYAPDKGIQAAFTVH